MKRLSQEQKSARFSANLDAIIAECMADPRQEVSHYVGRFFLEQMQLDGRAFDSAWAGWEFERRLKAAGHKIPTMTLRDLLFEWCAITAKIMFSNQLCGAAGPDTALAAAIKALAHGDSPNSKRYRDAVAALCTAANLLDNSRGL